MTVELSVPPPLPSSGDPNKGSNHGFPVNAPAHDFMGWHLSFNQTAEKDMMQSILSAIRTMKFAKGVELR